MANRRIPKRRKTPPTDDGAAGEPEFIDDDDILLAEDDDVEILDDDEVEEITGEVDELPGADPKTAEFDSPSVEPPVQSLDDELDEDDLEETGEQELPGPLSEVVTDEHDAPDDPLSSFAERAQTGSGALAFPADPVRPEDADFEELPEEDVEPTGRDLPPERPVWQEDSRDAAVAEAEEEVENPTRRLTPPLGKAPVFDDEVTDRSDGDDDVAAELVDEDAAPSPAFDLEPIGRHRRRRRRPPPRVAEPEGDHLAEAANVDLAADESDAPLPAAGDGTLVSEEPAETPPWQEDEDEATADGREAPVGEEPAAGGEKREVLQWSALPKDEEMAMPDVGPTRIESSDPAQPALDEKTLIFNDPDAVPAEEAPEPDCPFLLIIQGEEEGREIDLLRDEITIGRGPDNDLVFPDIACSRQHAMVERVGEQWQVSDLGSGNGTLLNGERVKEAILVDGDEIEVGNTVLQFNDPAAQAAGPERTPAPAGPRLTTVTGAMPLDDAEGGGFFTRLTADPKKKKMLVYGSVGLGGFLVLLLILRLVIPSGPTGPTPEQLAQQEAKKKRIEFDGHMRKADLAIGEKKWKDALLEVQLAKALAPDNRNLDDYLATIKREMAAASALEQARMFMEQKSWDSAIAAVNRVTSQSEYKADADKLKIQIDSQITETLLREGQDLMRANKFNQALLKFDEVLKRNPNNTEVTLAKRQCEEEIEREERKRRVAARRTQRTHRGRRHRGQRHQSSRSGVTGQTLSLYKNGEIDRAIAKAEESGSAEQLKLLKQFRSSYQLGMRLGKNPGQAAKAIKELRSALSLDKKISGGAGKYRSALSDRLARVYYIRGVDAQTGRDFPSAYKAYRASLKYKPDLERARNKLKELEKTAKKLYEEAYVIKATSAERAVKQLNIVMKIIPPDHVYYSKAKKLKARIQGPLGDTGGSSGF